MGYFGTVFKTALIFAAIGGILMLAAPHIAVAVGMFPGVGEACLAMAGKAAWTSVVAYNAAFFGGFGALSSALTPIVDSLFQQRNESESVDISPATAVHHVAQGQHIAMAHAPSAGAHAPGHAAGFTAVLDQQRFQEQSGMTR